MVDNLLGVLITCFDWHADCTIRERTNTVFQSTIDLSSLYYGFKEFNTYTTEERPISPGLPQSFPSISTNRFRNCHTTEEQTSRRQTETALVI